MIISTRSDNQIAGGNDMMPDSDLLRQFESLGSGCEFGFVQRFAGAEALGLFRFALTPTAAFLQGLEVRFEGVDDPARIEIFKDDQTGEWFGRMQAFDFVYHTGHWSWQASVEEVHALQGRRQKFLLRLLLEQLEQGNKIFVRFGEDTENEICAIAAAISKYGPGTVLWVTLSEPGHPGGSVERLAKNLLRGYIDRFWVPIPAERRFDVLMPQWLSICLNSHRMTWGGSSAPTSLPPVVHPPRRNLLTGLERRPEAIARSIALPYEDASAHVLLNATAFLHATLVSIGIEEQLERNAVYAFGMEVWIPLHFAGTRVLAVFVGLPAVQYVAADLTKRGCWQPIWASSLCPPDVATRVGLVVEGIIGDSILTKNWRMHEGSCLIDSFDTGDEPVVADGPLSK